MTTFILHLDGYTLADVFSVTDVQRIDIAVSNTWKVYAFLVTQEAMAEYK